MATFNYIFYYPWDLSTISSTTHVFFQLYLLLPMVTFKYIFYYPWHLSITFSTTHDIFQLYLLLHMAPFNYIFYYLYFTWFRSSWFWCRRLRSRRLRSCRFRSCRFRSCWFRSCCFCLNLWAGARLDRVRFQATQLQKNPTLFIMTEIIPKYAFWVWNITSSAYKRSIISKNIHIE